MALVIGGGLGWVGADAVLARAGRLVETGGWRLVSGALQPAVHGPWNSLWSAVERAAAIGRDPSRFPADILTVWSASGDEDGRPLDGRSRYVLRVGAAPVGDGQGFWSASVLDSAGTLFTGGGRPSIASRAADVRRDPDGTIEITLSAMPPDDPSANWLPAPAGPFRLVFRTFLLPRSDAPAPPAVRRRDTAA